MFCNEDYKGIISEYLKFGSVYKYEPKITKVNYIGFDDAVNEYSKLLHEVIKQLDESNPTYAISGGLDSSLIFSYLNKPDAICIHAKGNSDKYYATKLYPDVKIIEEYNNIDIEYCLIHIQKLWETPHCKLGDLFDWYVYQQSDNLITGDEIIHYNIDETLIRNPNNFFNNISIFSDREILLMGLEPPRKIHIENIGYLIDYIHNWYTYINRRIFFIHDHVKSPFMEVNKFYNNLPIQYLNNKKLIKTIIRNRLPVWVLERSKKSTIGPSKEWYEKNKYQYDNLKLKYLTKKSRKIFEIIPYDFVQSCLDDYKKMWTLLNLSIWMEIN